MGVVERRAAQRAGAAAGAMVDARRRPQGQVAGGREVLSHHPRRRAPACSGTHGRVGPHVARRTRPRAPELPGTAQPAVGRPAGPVGRLPRTARGAAPRPGATRQGAPARCVRAGGADRRQAAGGGEPARGHGEAGVAHHGAGQTRGEHHARHQDAHAATASPAGHAQDPGLQGVRQPVHPAAQSRSAGCGGGCAAAWRRSSTKGCCSSGC